MLRVCPSSVTVSTRIPKVLHIMHIVRRETDEGKKEIESANNLRDAMHAKNMKNRPRGQESS